MLNPTAACVPGESDCSKRLVLSECLERWEREAEVGVCDTGRYRCRYVVWGRGPTLVLIPGMASTARSFAMLLARLHTHFRCFTYDLPAGVDDGARLMTYRHADFVGDLFALLDHLRLRECFLYGASFGATIALAALHQQPARFSHGILQGGFARRPLVTTEILASSFARFLPGRLGLLPLFRTILERTNRETFLERDVDVWDFFVKQTSAVPLRAFATRALTINQLDLRNLLPTIRPPMLLICGDRDPVIGRAYEEELLRGLPRVARAEIERCGHEPHLTHPEVLAEVVRQFLQPQCGAMID